MSSLSDDDFRDLPPRERRYDVQVADNLFFAVFPNGVKTWVLVYRFDGLVRRHTIGTFPGMTVAEATATAAGNANERPPDDAHRPRRRWAVILVSLGLAAAGLVAAGFALWR